MTWAATHGTKDPEVGFYLQLYACASEFGWTPEETLKQEPALVDAVLETAVAVKKKEREEQRIGERRRG